VLRLGLLLFFSSTLTIVLRLLDILTFSDPQIKFVCLLALLGSILCFMGSYWAYEILPKKRLAAARRVFRRIRPIDLPGWTPTPKAVVESSSDRRIEQEKELVGVK